VRETINDPGTMRARDGGRDTLLEKRDAKTALHTRRDETFAQMNLLEHLAQATRPLLATRPVYAIALLGLGAAYKSDQEAPR
jgi:hypothetical protein